MNSLDLFKFLKNDQECQKYFIGVFARDELPLFLQKLPCCFILNTHNRDQPGEHWLAFFIDSNRNAEFFDPCGLQPSFYNLDVYLNQI